MKLNLAVITAATMIASAWTANATLVNYTVGGWSQQFPGPVTPPAGAPHSVDGFGYPGDTVTLQGGSGSFNLADGVTGTMNLGQLLWGVDYTYGGTATDWSQANWASLVFAISGTRTMTISSGASGSGNISQAGLLTSDWNDDGLSLSAGPMSSLNVQDTTTLQWYRVDITPNSLPIATVDNWGGGNPPTGGYAQIPRDVTADFTVTAVPEPTTMIAGALLLLPFGASTLRMLRKRHTA